MSGPNRRREPPAEHRFRKGTSGNPGGRPRAAPKPGAGASPLAVILERRLTISRSGRPREVTVEEALQHRALEDAFAGNRTARREVLRMIAERERWRAEHAPKPEPIERRVEHDPRNADEAMLLLGIAIPDPHCKGLDHRGHKWLLLASWAVQAAFVRRRGAPLSDQDIQAIESCTEQDAPDPQEAAG